MCADANKEEKEKDEKGKRNEYKDKHYKHMWQSLLTNYSYVANCTVSD